MAAIRLQHRVVSGQLGEQMLGQPWVMREGEPDVGALTNPLHHPGLHQKAQMAGKAWLRLAQNLGEFHHAERTAAG